MKKLFVSLFFVVVATLSVNAQQQHVIKTNPIALAFGSFNATYEKVLNTKSSVLVSGSYMFKFFNVSVNAGGLGAGYRYYFTHAKKEVPTGFYVMPEAAFSFGSFKHDDDSKSSFSSFGIGAELGYQWAWQSGFTLDLGIGPMYHSVTGNNTSGFSKTSGIGPAMTIAIGYAF